MRLSRLRFGSNQYTVNNQSTIDIVGNKQNHKIPGVAVELDALAVRQAQRPVLVPHPVRRSGFETR